MYEQILVKRNKERIHSLQEITQTKNTWFAQHIKLLTFTEVNLTALQKILYQIVRGLLKDQQQRHLQIVHSDQTQSVQDNVLTLLAEYDDVLRDAIPQPIYILIWQISSLERLTSRIEVVDDVLDVVEWYFCHQDNQVKILDEEDLDHEVMIDLYKEAVEDQDTDAQYQLGEYYNAKDGNCFQPEKSLKWFELAAGQGNADAQYVLGNFYFEGVGVEENYIQAFSLYEKAALQGHADAANNLADMYFNGEGVPQDFTLARKWFDFAASKNVAEAMFTLGIIYEQGLGVKKEKHAAFNAYKKSAEAGYVEAQYRLGGIYLEGRLDQAKDINRGLFWYERAAEQFHIDAFYDLGFIWSKGLTGIRNIEKGIHWFKQAALQGDADAKLQLGHIYNKGEGVARNLKEAIKWYGLAADAGIEEAAKIVEELKGL
ncbi:SEL1-like repeat protein [Lysinibacillus fusiformis]|uniref:SEL1-like repeat protein n=1 Tax=Lysinibacillus fusiformis TaxID=28031 RepID=UPI003829B8B9